MVVIQARREEETGHPVDDERRSLKRNHKRPEGLRRQRPICGVIAPRRHLSPRRSSLQLDHSRHNATTEVLLGVLNLSIFRSTAGIRLFVKPQWFRILRGEIDE